jgi:hypothetical protein
VTWQVLVQNLRQAHVHHLGEQQGDIIDALGDNDQLRFAKEFLCLTRQLDDHRAILYPSIIDTDSTLSSANTNC